MSYTPLTGTGDGTAPVVNITFTYLDKSHVKAAVDGVEVGFTWTGASQITFSSVVGPTHTWTVYRETPADPLVDFANGAVMLEEDLNKATEQPLFREQELDQKVGDIDGALSAANAAAASATAAADAANAAVAGITPLDPSKSPQRLSYGARNPTHTLRQAVALADSIHTQLVGPAASATGGSGSGNYFLVDNESTDANTPNSWAWALAAAKAATGGATIHFETRGHLDIIIDHEEIIDADNLTIIAPGRNVTFWMVSLLGQFSYRNASNIITAYIEFRTLPGTLATYDDVTGLKAERKLVSVDPASMDLIAFLGCEFRHASDGALDINSPSLLSTSPVSRVTVQDFIFWDTDQPMMVGSEDPTCAVGDAAKLQLGLHNGVFAYCGERQPKVLGRTHVEMTDTYTLTLPFQRDQLAPVNEFGAVSGMHVYSGGTGRCRGCLWETPVNLGAPVNITEVDLDGNGVDGAVDVIDSASGDANLVITTGNTGRITPDDTVAHTPVPAVGSLRDAWVADRWARSGAKPDPAPDGFFIWTTDTTPYPNGDTVVADRSKGLLAGRWLRVDMRAEYPADKQRQSVDTLTGTYTPALTAVENVSSLALSRANYQRSGDRVEVSMVLSGTITNGNARVIIDVALPFAHDLASSADVQGDVRVISSTNQAHGYVTADTAADKAELVITPTNASGSVVTFAANFVYML